MNEHTRLAIAGGIFAGTALAAIAIGWLASPAKPLAPVPQAKGWTVEQMRTLHRGVSPADARAAGDVETRESRL